MMHKTSKLFDSRQKSKNSRKKQKSTLQRSRKYSTIKKKRSKCKSNKSVKVHRRTNCGGTPYVKQCKVQQNVHIVTGHGKTLYPNCGFYIPLGTNIITVTSLGNNPVFFQKLGYVDNVLHNEILRLYSTEPNKINGTYKSRTLFKNDDNSHELTNTGTNLQTYLNTVLPNVSIRFKNHLPWPHEILKKRRSTRTTFLQHLKDFQKYSEHENNMFQNAYFFPSAPSLDSYKEVLVRDHIQVIDGILKGLTKKEYNDTPAMILGPLVNRSGTYRYPIRLRKGGNHIWVKPTNIHITSVVSLKGLPQTQNEYNGETAKIVGIFKNEYVVRPVTDESKIFSVEHRNVVHPADNPVAIHAVVDDSVKSHDPLYILEDKIVLLDEYKYATPFNNSLISFLPQSREINSECLITCVDTNHPADFNNDKDIHTQDPDVTTTIENIVRVEGDGTYIIIACRPLDHLIPSAVEVLRQRSDS